jgi:hypothetical protein
MLRGLTGDEIHFTKIQMGAGAQPDPLTATALANMKLNLTIDEMTVGDNYATLSTSFSNSTITEGFRATEIGFFAQNPDNTSQDILYAYGTEVSDIADYVPANNERILEVQFDAFLFIGDAENVTAAINSSLVYASASEFNEHVADTGNPHTVTKSQVGLGSVPNVTTNNQTPTYSTPSTLATLTSGELLSTAFGKIKLAITNLISHIANKQNPHSVTLAQVGGAAASHQHNASDIDAGTLPVARGGTGTTSFTTGGILKGNSTRAVSALTGVGALYADSSGSPIFGTLPVSRGGTGKTTQNDLAQYVNAAGIVKGVYSGNNAADRTINLGFTPKAVLVFSFEGNTHDDIHGYSGGLALSGWNSVIYGASTSYATTWSTSYCVLGIVTNGFRVNYNANQRIYSNTSGDYYYYIAIR